MILKLLERCINKIYRLFGFELKKIDLNSGILKIDNDGVTYLRGASTTKPPPSNVPENLQNLFTTNGKIPIIYKYFDDRTNVNQPAVHNTELIYRDAFKKLDNKKFHYYGNEINAFYDAMKKYPLDGKSVLVWGLNNCNCEAIALWNNALKVYVVDYNKPICDHKKIEVLSHDELKNLNIKTDAAFSYSSFEHDGLGRYGDPINPDGDLQAMQGARNTLNDGGLLFLGIPLGNDCLYWNANRIYGKIRLPLLLKGWHCVDVYNIYKKITPEYPFDLPLGGYIQCILVCKKIPTDCPEDSALAYYIYKDIRNEGSVRDNTHDPEMLNQISKIILDFKYNENIVSK
ncbi:hypothetical protein FACS1894137_06930 [Spirochaetia bacterium]|nr:hypothetical protein FACS1894137_06930 [Spirochaetia bacterium]